jgi:hypothetical protein
MKLTRRKNWDSHGVSEVVATILTLSITVVLFSTIISMVNTIPTPSDNIYTEFSAEIEWIGGGAYIRITNTGGTIMTYTWARVILSVNATTQTLNTKGSIGPLNYGVGMDVIGHEGPDDGDADWDTGEIWVIRKYTGEIYENSDVGVMIVDLQRNAVAWSATILGKKNQFGPIISDMWVDSNILSLRRDPVEFGMRFYFFAKVTDPDGDLDISTVRADISSVDAAYNNIALYDPDGDGTFRSDELDGPQEGSVPVGYHMAIVFANDTNAHYSSAAGRIAVGQDIGAQPNLVIHKSDLKVSDLNPTNGQDISVTVTVTNYGGACTGLLEYHDVVANLSTLITNRSYFFTIAEAPAQYTKTISFTVKGGGPHIINASAYPVNATDFNPHNNWNTIDINVMPTILLVDDDGHMPDGSGLDTVSYMKAALDSCDFKYDLYIVNPGYDGPDYLYGEMALKDYDIVIWMCGYRSTDTLRPNDQANLEDFVNDNLTSGVNGGSLWLIGQKIFEDPAIPGSFYTSVLKVQGPVAPVPIPGPTILRGVAGNPISQDWNDTALWMPTIERVPGEDYSYPIDPNVGEGANITFLTSDSRADAINHEHPTTGSRKVFFPFEYSRIKRIADQTQVTFRVIMWLGNISAKFGMDLSISEQTTEPTYVFVNQYINVTAAIRNNGNETLHNVEAILIVDGAPDRGHLVDNLTVERMGGTTLVSTLWKAEGIGTHVLLWMVDPDNHIEETNEHNNMISSYVSTGQVFVKFRILVVDDDGSTNNMGVPSILHDETTYVTDSLLRLGYEYESPNGTNTTYVVGTGLDGPSYDIVKDYSAVIWVTGSAGSGLTAIDNSTLSRYLLNNNGCVWLVGEDLGLAGTNLSGVMGIQNIAPNAGLPDRLLGVDNSPVSHGMDIPTIGSPFADVLEPASGAEGVFYQDRATDQYCAVMSDQGDYKGVTFAFNFSALYGSSPGLISGNNAVDEITYLVLHSFDFPETRKEARITTRDYAVSDQHPLIGSAYILRAKVHNVGAQSANLLVRFMDGNVQIGANSIAVEPDQATSAEIIWRPLFAGNRTIRILVDPVAEAPEIFEWFNNNISFNIHVYFFWDDMESGTGKWTHASTIMNINGEGPLDYYNSYTTLFTNISTDWDWSMSEGIENTTVTAKSHPSSFYIPEGGGFFGEIDVIVSFAIDDSRSMTFRTNEDLNLDYDTNGDGNPTNDITWLDNAKDACFGLLEMLSDDSVVVSIWDFNGNHERRWCGPTQAYGGRIPTDNTTITFYDRPPIRMGDIYSSIINGTNVTGRQYIRDEIRLMENPPGQTILWDSIGEAYLDNQWWTGAYPELDPVVIVLSDGADLQASDTSAPQPQKFEAGSEYWCPWGNESDGMQYYEMHRGKYTFDMFNPNSTTKWLRALDHGGSIIKDRLGLLYAGMRIFTIGLGLEHHDPVWMPQISNWPGEVVDLTNAVCTDQTPFDDPTPCLETGTVEYNLWRIANTTGAEYFYAPDPDDLVEIFIQLGAMLATGINQTKSGTPMPQVDQLHNNSDKWAVTDSFNLENLEAARLSFWHKYNILAGGHGGYLQVGYKDPAVGGVDDWDWKYLIPLDAYTGNLKNDEFIYDDFGTRIFWCWNGLSGGGTYTWDYISVDILTNVPAPYRSEVRIKFNYTQFGGGTGVGWFIDDVRLVVSRSNAINPVSTTYDIWNLTAADAHSGTHSWSNIDPGTGLMKPGIDNSLVTTPIDLTNAQNAYLSAYVKFNINEDSGAPPDGFRIEVSSDGGKSWAAINLGVRTSWGVSGTGVDGEDGNPSDGKAYTGLPDSGDPVADGYWVHTSTLSRVNADLSAWMGNQIYIRFRMVTCSHPAYAHESGYSFTSGEFFGFYVDDVIVEGETIFG